MAAELILIDLSSLAYPIWHTSQSEPDPNHASQQIISRVYLIANAHPHVAICCDSGKSFRKDVAPSYKANRPEHDASLQHQIRLACDRLAHDGFPVWSVPSFEADDLIAAATARAILTTDMDVLIVSGDKDILQLVGPRVKAKSVRDGAVIDEAGVKAKFGVRPEQIRDYLCLVGDASDNVRGAKGVGPKRAAELLSRFDSLDGIFEAMKQPITNALTPALVVALKEFSVGAETTKALISLRADVEIPFEEVLPARVARAAEEFQPDEEHEDEPMSAETDPPAVSQETASQPSVPVVEGPTPPQAQTGLALREVELIEPNPAQWERQLDPLSMKDARVLAKDMYDSHMFSAYGSPQAVLSTVMVGRELGLPAMSSLRSVHVIEGKHSLSAAVMVALVLKSGLAEYFEPISFSETEATYETKRKGARNPIRLTHTIEMAQKAWPKTKADWQKAYDASGWGRVPTDMLVARAQSRLARMVYPDLLAGLYTPDELTEIKEQQVAA